MITLGNDVAKWQGDINFDVLKSNTQFVIIKATEGVGYTDTKFKRNQSEARRVRLQLGYYHFARPDKGNSPVAEADYFLNVVGTPKNGELFALDYECPNQNQAHVTWCRQFMDRIFKQIGVRPFIYLNQAEIKNFSWQEVIDGNYGLWIAAYTYDPNDNTFNIGEFPSAAIQQWSNKQKVPGINVDTDGNVFFGSLVILKKYGYKTPVVPVPPVPTPDIRLSLLDQAGIIDEPLTRLAIERYNRWDQLQNDSNNATSELNALKIKYASLKQRVKTAVIGAIDSMV